jgi:hypothetical protein
MGMDIYGLKPKVKGKRPEIDWNKPTTEEERNKYFKKLEKFEAENVGYYFRNNVWFWRPLANLITVLNEEWLTEEQKERLQDNSGFEFRLQDLSQKLLKLFKSNETRVVELVASGEDTEATLILFFDKMTWQRDA